MKALGFLGLLGLVAALPAHPAHALQTTPSALPATGAPQPVILDRVVAIINGQVLLQSDVEEERKLAALEPLRVSPRQDTEAEAAHRLIRRTLILAQMQEQAQPTTVSAAEAETGLEELRASLHQCAPYSCTSAEGWDKFLKAHGLTEAEALQRWSQRMAIQRFIDLRFRAGIRISPSDIHDYYEKTLEPALEARHEPPPPLKNVSARIQQLLLEERVNAMISDWLRSLRAEGSVQILVPAYGSSSGSPDQGSE
jgi:peptidyl-prolyl cis-trans isomerase SurA